MTLIEGIKLVGNPAYIPECKREEMPELFVHLGYKVGAEIGVYRGEFTELFCKAGLRMYGIDPWTAFSGAGRSQNKQDRQDGIFLDACNRLSSYDCALIRKSSMAAVEDFEDESLDFVYIDGNHMFRYIAEDVTEWSKKVRKGGIVSGHDYFDTRFGAKNVVCNVRSVINAYVWSHGINQWYVFGQPEGKKEERSWMWFK